MSQRSVPGVPEVVRPGSGRRSVDGWEDVSGLTLRAGFSRAMYGLAAIYLLAAILDAVVLGVPGLVLVLGLAAGFMAGAAHQHRRRPMATTTLQSVAWLIVLAIECAWTVHALVLGWPSFALLMAGTLLAAASVLPGLRIFLLADLVALVGFGSAAVTRLDDPNWVLSALSLVLGLAVAHILQVFGDGGRRQLQDMASALAVDATHDPLTGLLNRQGLTDALCRLLPPSLAGEPAPQLAVVCFDVNGFKPINDELGHATGDLVLIELATQMRHLGRVGDALARTGGDEFVLVMAGATAESAVRVRDQARLRLRGCAGVLQLPWSVSVGQAFGKVRSLADVEELQRAADLAMYEDKRAYRVRGGSQQLIVDPQQS